MQSEGTVHMVDSIVHQNTAATVRGGGICSFAALKITNCKVTNNAVQDMSWGLGGGIFSSGSQHLDTVLVENNEAFEGGGVYTTADIDCKDVNFTQNSAAASGGGE